jgi:[NiFe] hydrogenase assembly HybE family chaperone
VSGDRECGVCWHVYRPEEGDDVWQVPAGVPFEGLPEHWRCPRCDSPKEKFLPLRSPPEPAPVATPRTSASEDPGSPLGRALTVWRRAGLSMRDLPVYNPALEVEAVGFRPFEGGSVGVVISPWFMNLVLLPAPGAAPLGHGEKRIRSLPGEAVEVTGAWLEGAPPMECCSLFSPMGEFGSQEVARLTALETLAALWRRPADLTPSVEPQEPPAGRGRRALLRPFLP